MNRKSLIPILLIGALIRSVNAIPFGTGITYYSEIGGGKIIFDSAFVASSVSWSASHIVFSAFDMGTAFNEAGFKNPNSGTTMTVNSLTSAELRYTVAGGAGVLSYGAYLPTVTTAEVLTAAGVTAWNWNGLTHLLSVTQNVFPLQIVVRVEIGGGGGGALPPEEPDTQPTVILPTTNLVEVPEWVPPPVEEIIVRVYPWWQKYGSAVIICAVVVVFLIYAFEPKKRGGGLDVVLNPDKFFR